MDYLLFKTVLEYIPIVNTINIYDENNNNNNNNNDNNNNNNNDSTFIDPLVKEIQNYIIEKTSNTYIVSLSGGVDSMVLASILKLLNKQVIGVHINYNNRIESVEEARFLEVWCNDNNIELIVHNIENIQRGKIKRYDYELQTKNIRFDLYKDVLTKYNCEEIFLGHHKGDIIENVFNNICRGRNILDLVVIKSENTILDVKICRPMLNVYKNIIFDYAHLYNIPYFKDTTPEWSLRGIFRNQIYPLLNITYSLNLSQNLMSIADESTDWNMLIENKILEPFIQTIIYTDTTVVINIGDYIDYPLCFWMNVLTKIFYKFGKSSPSKKSIQNLLIYIKDIIITKKTNKIQLSNSCIGEINNNNNNNNNILTLYFSK